MSPGYCPYDSCAVGGDWAAPPHAPAGDTSGAGGAAGVVGGVGGGDSALTLPGDVTASPASLGCGVVPPESCVSSIYSGQSVASCTTCWGTCWVKPGLPEVANLYILASAHAKFLQLNPLQSSVVTDNHACACRTIAGDGYGSTYTTDYGSFEPATTSSACAGASTCGTSCGGAGGGCGGGHGGGGGGGGCGGGCGGCGGG
jgi:hypothetical protein